MNFGLSADVASHSRICDVGRCLPALAYRFLFGFGHFDSLRKISQASTFPVLMADKPRVPSPGAEPPAERSPWALVGLGVQFCAALLVGVSAGNWLDRQLGSAPVFLLVGLFGFGGGTFVVSYRRLMKPAAPRSTEDTESLPKR